MNTAELEALPQGTDDDRCRTTGKAEKLNSKGKRQSTPKTGTGKSNEQTGTDGTRSAVVSCGERSGMVIAQKPTRNEPGADEPRVMLGVGTAAGMENSRQAGKAITRRQVRQYAGDPASVVRSTGDVYALVRGKEPGVATVVSKTEM